MFVRICDGVIVKVKKKKKQPEKDDGPTVCINRENIMSLVPLTSNLLCWNVYLIHPRAKWKE